MLGQGEHSGAAQVGQFALPGVPVEPAGPGVVVVRAASAVAVAAVAARAEPAAGPGLASGGFQKPAAVYHRWLQWPFVAEQRAQEAEAGQPLRPPCGLRRPPEVWPGLAQRCLERPLLQEQPAEPRCVRVRQLSPFDSLERHFSRPTAPRQTLAEWWR